MIGGNPMYYAFIVLSGSIIKGEQVQNSIKWLQEILSNVDNIVAIITDILVAIVGVYGIRYLNKIKEKNYNATFGYYARLKVRLHMLNSILEENKRYILDRFIPEADRISVDMAKEVTVKLAIEQLVENAKETLVFLKTSEEQMPASNNWFEKYGRLLEFLEDCVKLSNTQYFKWNDDYGNNQEKYYALHKVNIEEMINDIVLLQVETGGKLYKKERKNGQRQQSTTTS